MKSWYTRSEALAALGVRPQTLYAYASRGRIGVAPDPADPRRSLYSRGDVDGLVARRDRGRRPAAIAASTMSWGEPIIATAISTIAGGRLHYRGRDAIELSEHATMESVAALLWEEPMAVRLVGEAAIAPTDAPPFLQALELLAKLSFRSHPILGRAPVALRVEAGRLIGDLAAAFGASADGGTPLHLRIGAAWERDAAASDSIRRALVLLADQELTTSAFASRVVASTGASLASCMLAGLSALSGPLHGGATNRVRSLLDDVSRMGPDGTVDHYLARGQQIPGFGHPLYPDGDPRAASLLGAFEPPAVIGRLIGEVRTQTGLPPTIDVALEAMRVRYDLPHDASLSLFAIARSVGMVAHAIEQNGSGALIRPRARYVGPNSERVAT